MALKDLFKKKENPKKEMAIQPESADISENQSREAFLKENYRKTLTVALEINRLRSSLPEIMKDNPPEQLQVVNEQLEHIEKELKGAKVATADLGNNDALAIEVIKNLSCLLANSQYEPYRNEGLSQLKSALTEDWFQPDGMTRLERKLALVMALEGMIKAEIDELQLMSEIKLGKTKLSSLMEAFDASGSEQSLSAEILMLKNRIEFLKNQLADIRAQRIEESNLYDLTRSVLKKLPVQNNPVFAGIYESLEKEQSQQLTQAIERVRKITEKLIANKVELEMAAEKMASEGIILSPETVKDIREMISEQAEHVEESGTEQAATVIQKEESVSGLEL